MLSAAAVATLALGACSNDNPETPVIPDDNQQENSQENTNEKDLPDLKPYTELKLTPAQEAVRKANNEFAVSMMKDVMEMQEGESTVLSPFSLYTVLSMVSNGDNGATRDQLLRTLGFEGGEEGLAQMNEFNSFMMTQLPELDTRAYALVSNSMWVGRNMPVLPSFTASIEKWYSADVFSLPTLTDNNAREQINAWCADKTKGMIPEFLKNNLNGDVAVLNATYFKGIWESGFKKENTAKAQFTNLDGSKSQVDMMRQTTHLHYAKTADAEIVGLDYGNGNFRMTCILPQAGTDLNAYVSRMTAASLQEDCAKAQSKECILRMPKFDIGSNQNLTKLLERRGLDLMFTPGCNAILSGNYLPIDAICQETRVSTDEGGTVGAAVTIAVWVGADPTVEPPKPVEVTFDRPFLFVIEETSTGTILFLGAVTKF